MDWTEKYRPTTLSEIRGNDKSRDALRTWAETWDDHREAVIVYGSPGVGKTSAAHALAADLGWDVLELNASDDRTASVIERVAGEAARSGTLTGGSGGRKLVILDEADNLHGNVDRGGTRAIGDVVKEARQPVVLIANEYYEMSSGLRNACQDIEFRDVSKRSIVPVLRDICRREGVEYEDAALEAIAERDNGDLRSAINDLQAAAQGRDRITADDVVTGQRDRTEDIWTFLDMVLKEGSPREALRTSYDVDETPDSLMQWVEDKVPKVYEPAEIARAYDSLAAGDRWLGRVRATQNYSYWRYAGDMLAAGVAAARDHERGGWTRYGGPPFRSRTRQPRDDIAQRVGAANLTSSATARRDLLPYLAAMTHHCKNRELTVAMAAALDMNEKDVAFVTGSGEDTNKVQDIVAEAEEARAAVGESGGTLEQAVAGATDGADSDPEPDGPDSTLADLADADTDEAPSEPTDDADDDSQSGLSDFA